MKSIRVNAALLSVVAAAALLAGCGKTTTPTSTSSSFDNATPTPPSQVVASLDPTAGYQVLSWQPSPDADVATYDIFQYAPDPSQDMAYVPVASVPASVLSWRLPPVNNTQTRWYRVRSTNNGGQHSALTSPTAITLFPPSQGTGGGGTSGPDHGDY